MKKIKSFKINPRLREAVRIYKAAAKAGDVPAQAEELIQKESQRVYSLVSTAAVYETFTCDKMPLELQINPPDKWVAASLFLVTIGSDIEQNIREIQQKNDIMHYQSVHSVALEALDQSVNFVQRLISDEAKDESCEITRQHQVPGSQGWSKFFEILPGEKAGIRLVNEDMFDPIYTSGGIFYWTPVKKSKK